MAFDSEEYNPNLTRGTSSTVRGAEHFFKKLKEKSEKIANAIVQNRADVMYTVLRYRFPLGSYNGKDLGRYPRYDARTKKGKDLSKQSYKEWSVTPKSNGRITIQNSATAPTNNFSYPLLLLNGSAGGKYKWGSRVPLGKGKVNAMGFSTQMPYGITPFLLRHRDKLKAELKEQIGAIT